MQETDIHKKTNISGATKIELKDLSPYSIGQLLSLWKIKLSSIAFFGIQMHLTNGVSN